MGAFSKIRTWAGGALVRSGMRILGFKPEEIQNPGVVDNGEDDDEYVAAPVVKLSAEAERMVAEGQRVEFYRPEYKDPPLKGSAHEQAMQARAKREMGI